MRRFSRIFIEANKKNNEQEERQKIENKNNEIFINNYSFIEKDNLMKNMEEEIQDKNCLYDDVNLNQIDNKISISSIQLMNIISNITVLIFFSIVIN